MLTKVDVSSDLGQSMTLSLEDTIDGYIVEKIDGLGPVKATLISSNFASFDGSQYQSSRRENRNIVFSIGLESDFVTNTVQSLRDKLYDFFMPESRVSMRFYNNDKEYDIVGYVESCEPDHFSRDPKINISIICFTPDFMDPASITVNGNTVSDDTEFVIDYEGTVPTGIVFVLSVDRNLSEFTIYNRTGDSVTRSLDFSAILEDGDILTISTVPGDKYATLLRATVETSILYGISPQVSWIQLLRGENDLRVYAEGDPIPFTLTYVTRYGGL